MSRIHRAGRVVRAGLVVTVLAAGCADKERTDPTAEAVANFNHRVDDYMTLRKSVADSAGTIDENSTQDEIAKRSSGLAAGIISVRPTAKQGDIFAPDAAAVFATLIRQEYQRRPDSVQEVREDTQAELPDFVPRVNMVYPTSYPLATFPPTLLPLLPKLPEQLEYRVVTHYLILRDIEANVIVDFMPNAIP